jgi:hypothetical protein
VKPTVSRVGNSQGKAGGLKDLNRSKRLDELRRSCSLTLAEQIGVCQRFYQRFKIRSCQTL